MNKLIFSYWLILISNRKFYLRKTFLLLIFFILVGSPVFASTYYMATTGSNSNNGSLSAPWLTLQYSFSKMKGGDTLIIKDGTYTGSSNVINNSYYPPTGSSGAYTIIKAENAGKVIFDGQSTRNTFDVQSDGNKYWQFEGLTFINNNGNGVYLRYADYIKFINCGAGGVMPAGWYAWSFRESSYILLEGCYGWGTGRYQFITYLSDHIIFRQCVGRPDNIKSDTNPVSVFTAYSSNYIKFQNCIAIDADQNAYFSGVNAYIGAFSVPTTSGQSTYVDFDQCISVNVKFGGIFVAQNSPTSNINFRNIVLWDNDNTVACLVWLRNPSTALNLTAGMTAIEENYSDGSSTTVKNSIFYGNTITNAFWSASPTYQNYNSYYGNSNTTGRKGANDITNVNPTTNSLKYLPRIEAGGSLKGVGESGADIGANCMTLIGTPGTLWGETGYATDTGKPMWPFPNEDIIKTRMAAYSNGGVSGARGFAASGKQKNGVDNITLTSYIWEYLGNQMPSDIYSGYGGGVDTTPPGAPQGVDISVTH